jgi:NTP pyrophosphatase (non-canonical NTP hydrolase)
MRDDETTISELKQAIKRLVIQKGWGENGVQNVQHVAMAMTVEMSELLENFQWLEKEDVTKLQSGGDPERAAKIAEEFADVMMYGLQLTDTLNIDVSAQIERKIGIVLKRPLGVRGRDIESGARRERT